MYFARARHNVNFGNQLVYRFLIVVLDRLISFKWRTQCACARTGNSIIRNRTSADWLNRQSVIGVRRGVPQRYFTFHMNFPLNRCEQKTHKMAPSDAQSFFVHFFLISCGFHCVPSIIIIILSPCVRRGHHYSVEDEPNESRLDVDGLKTMFRFNAIVPKRRRSNFCCRQIFYENLFAWSTGSTEHASSWNERRTQKL